MKPAPNLSGRITPTYDIPIPGPMMPIGMRTVTNNKTNAAKNTGHVARKVGKLSNKISAGTKSKAPTKQSSTLETRKTMVAKKKRSKKAKR